jgi:transposase-like protein
LNLPKHVDVIVVIVFLSDFLIRTPENTMPAKKAPRIPLPKAWTRQVRSAMLHLISLAQYVTVYTRSWAVDSMNGRVRLKAENDRLRQEIALLREEIRIKDVRMVQINPHRRPHYPPTERMAILELSAARGWSLEQAANTFLLTAPTVASWMKRVDEQGTDALVQLREPVNKFPEFVRYAVQRLKILCPNMGKVKIAQTLCRAGLHLGATTVGRIVKEPPQPKPQQPTANSARTVVAAKEPDHVWHVDLTAVSSRHSGRVRGSHAIQVLDFAPDSQGDQGLRQLQEPASDDNTACNSSKGELKEVGQTSASFDLRKLKEVADTSAVASSR